MLKLIKYLKQSWLAIVFIVVLLAIQALCDLSLPSYTSNIVNVGIQQGGVENAVPTVIRKSELEKILLFIENDSKDIIKNNYKLVSRDDLSKNEISKYENKYKVFKKEDIYELKTTDKDVIEEMNDVISKPMLVVSLFESDSEETKKIKEQMKSQMEEMMKKQQNIQGKESLFLDESQNSTGMNPEIRDTTPVEMNPEIRDTTPVEMNLDTRDTVSNGISDEQSQSLKNQELQNQTLPLDSKGEIDVFKVFETLPQEQLNTVIKNINEKIKNVPSTIIDQSAIKFVKNEYKKIGINTDKMQNNYIVKTGGLMLAVALVSVLTSVSVGFIASRVAAKTGRNLRGFVFEKVMLFSNAEINKFSTASLITRTTNDIQQIQVLMVMLLRVVFLAPIMAVGGVLKVLKTNTGMAWIIGIAVLAILAIVLILFSFVMPKFKLIQKLVDRLNLVSREIITGMDVIRAFTNEDFEEKRFEKANRDLTKTNLFVNRMMTVMMPLMMLVMNLISILIVWKGAYGINSGDMQVGDMMAFIQYTMQIIMSFLMISMVSIMLPRAAVSANRIDEVLTTKLSILDPEQSRINEKHNLKQEQTTKGLIEFRDVTFAFPDSEEPVLKNLSFVAKPGETTAIIGSTGCGKSSLINLIPRFYDVTSGSVLVDGVDVRDMSKHDLREKIGYVPQKGVLFSGTIESNIKYSDLNASDEEMIKAAEIAQATEFIEQKEEKYDAEISQGGTNVSGGQKQRLSIARAIMKNPEILIFDDSFSALDLKTDAKLRKALEENITDCTKIIVAQRISTILNAEQIIVLDNEQIVGKGTHSELLRNCEVYRQIASSQLTEEELKNE